MNTYKVSELASRHRAQRAYVIHWATHPDKGSSFERATRFIQWLPDGFLFFLLVRCLRYDGLICYEEGELLGHVFLQRHRRHWGVFSVFVAERFRRRGIAKNMVAECLRHAYVETGILRVHIGSGGDPAIQHIAELAIENKLCLPFPLKHGDKKGAVAFIRSLPTETSRRLLLQNLHRVP